MLLRQGGQKGIHTLTRGVSLKAFSPHPEGVLLALADEDRRVQVWDLTERRFRGQGQVLPHYIEAMIYTLDGTALLVGLHDGQVARLDGENAQLLEMTPAHQHTVTALACGPSGQLASSARDGSVVFWSSAGEVEQTLRHSTSVSSLACVSTGNTLFLGDEEGGLWRSEALGRLECVARGTAPLLSITHSLQSDTLFIGTQTGQILMHTL